MATFNEREKGEEARFARSAEAEFKINVRRNKLLGLWVGEHLGLKGAAADTYAKEVIQVDFTEPGSEDVFRKIWADVQAAKVNVSEHQIRREMDRFKEVAATQLEAEAAKK
ncbi:MAG: DUF1476 domain-containing protein [Alphaproteobacteria bacterium]|nr:DUF1476 domain-containing protein [Alphaproteobacteria bacterium]